MKRFYSCLLTVLLTCALPQWVAAQSACDKLFANGVKFQQTMTISSQRKAIEQFEKAKICYDSQAKKDLCDQQIKACRNIIAQIEKSNAERTETEVPVIPQNTVVTSRKNDLTVSSVAEKREVELSLGENYIKFKGKGDEFIKVKVICNYSDWEVVEAPDWVNYSRNDESELVIEAKKNPDKGERSGTLRVRCGDVDASLTIIQEKYKKFIIL